MDYVSKGAGIWVIEAIDVGDYDRYVVEKAQGIVRYCKAENLDSREVYRNFTIVKSFREGEDYADSGICVFPTKECAEDYASPLSSSGFFPGPLRVIPVHYIKWSSSHQDLNTEIKRLLSVNPIYKRRLEESGLIEVKTPTNTGKVAQPTKTASLQEVCTKLDTIIALLSSKQGGGVITDYVSNSIGIKKEGGLPFVPSEKRSEDALCSKLDRLIDLLTIKESVDYVKQGVGIWLIQYSYAGMSDYYVSEGAKIRIDEYLSEKLPDGCTQRELPTAHLYKRLSLRNEKYYARYGIVIFPTKEGAEDYIVLLKSSGFYPGELSVKSSAELKWSYEDKVLNGEIRRVISENPVYNKRLRALGLIQGVTAVGKNNQNKDSAPVSLEGKVDTVIGLLTNKQGG